MKPILDFVFLRIIGPWQIILLLIVVLFIGILPFVFYLITLQNTLKAIRVENRKLPPEQVWLTFIPLFGLIWQFIIVNRLADSLRAEFNQRNIQVLEDRPGIGIGLTYCILFCIGIIPYLGFFTSLAGLICWIVYWVKINNYRMLLLHN